MFAAVLPHRYLLISWEGSLNIPAKTLPQKRHTPDPSFELILKLKREENNFVYIWKESKMANKYVTDVSIVFVSSFRLSIRYFAMVLDRKGGVAFRSVILTN